MARDWEGEVLGIYPACVEMVADTFVIEALSAWRAMEWASDMGFWWIVLEGDSLAVISKLRHNGFDWSPIGTYVEAAKRLSPSFQRLQILHVKCDGNAVAHRVAKEAFYLELQVCWVEEFPFWLHYLVEADRTEI